MLTTCLTQAQGVLITLAVAPWVLRKPILQSLGVLWAFVAFVWFFCFRHFQLFVLPIGFSWPWQTRPAWFDLLTRGWNGIPWEIVIQGGLLLWIAAVAAVLGWRVMRRLASEKRTTDHLSAIVWGAGLVLGALAMLVFTIGVLGGLHHARLVFGAILGTGSLFAAWILWRSEKQTGDRRLEAGGTDEPQNHETQSSTLSPQSSALSLQPCPLPALTGFSPAEWAVLAAIAILQFLALLYALTPEIQSDALRYHLAAPQEWLKRGRLSYLPYNAFSNFPSNIEMLFLFGLGLAGDLLAKGFHFLFLPLTTGAAALITREILGESAKACTANRTRQEGMRDNMGGMDRVDRMARMDRIAPNPVNPVNPVEKTHSWWRVRPALLAALAWGTLPITIPLAGWGFIDLGLTYYTLGLVFFLLRWTRTMRTRDWVLAAVFGGLLCGSKYTGVVTVFWSGLLMAPVALWKAKTEKRAGRDCGMTIDDCGLTIDDSGRAIANRQSTIRNPQSPALLGLFLRVVAFGAIAAAIASPWWIKNCAYTGNPVYPMAWKLFGGGEWSGDLARFYYEKTQEKGILAKLHTPRQLLLNIVRLPWSTAQYPELFEGFEIGPFFWVFSPWIFVWLIVNLLPPCASHRSQASSLKSQTSSLSSRFLALWTICFCLFWFFSYQSNRFFLPGWALAIVITAATLAQARRRRATIQAITLVAFLLPVLYGAADSARWLLFDVGKLGFEKAADGRIVVKSGATWPAYTLGFLRRQDYLALNLSYARAAEYCSTHLGPTDKALLVGEHRKFHWRCRVEGNDWYDQPYIVHYLNQAENVDQLLDAFLTDGFTHVFFNLDEWGWPESKGAVPPGEMPPVPRGSAWHYNQRHFTPANIRLLQDLLKSSRLKTLQSFRPGRIYVAKILPRPTEPQPK
jgi:hypothetical protein